MPIFSEIEEGRADKKYNSPEIDDRAYRRLKTNRNQNYH
jgi:hypothetical protein